MLKANFEDARFEGVEIKRGEFATSYQRLSDETGLSIKQIRNTLKKLQKSGDIEIKRAQRFTLIKCCNYSLYQDCKGEEGHFRGSKRALKGHEEGSKRATSNNNNNNNNNNKNNNNNTGKSSCKKMKSKPSYDLEEIKRRSALDDDYISQLFGE